MRELREIVEGWEALRRQSHQTLLATVVATRGSTYRRPGARLLLSAERWVAGGVSGGCLERDVLTKSWWRTADGPRLVTYDSTSADDEETWTFGLGCNGVVEVLLERLPVEGEMHPLEYLAERVRSRRPGVLATVFRAAPGAGAAVGQRLFLDERGVRTDLPPGPLQQAVRADAEAALRSGQTLGVQHLSNGAPVEILVEAVRPPRSLVVFGSGQDAVPLVRMAAALGFQVTVVADSPAGVPAELFREASARIAATPSALPGKLVLEPDAACVVMTHNLDHDTGFLRFALASGSPYVGVLGPRLRTERLLQTLRDEGFSVGDAELRRLYAPVGLDLGADQPEEIALAILAEIQAVSAAAHGRSLRERQGPIHPRSDEPTPVGSSPGRIAG
jgi:xanthine/CO dehydrogenase XdhC/CoxF family maturation factor